MKLWSATTWSVLGGLVSITSAIQFETLTHCIYLNKKPICPGTTVEVEGQVTIMAGFIDDSADQESQAPAWNEETYQLQKIIPNHYDTPAGSYSIPMLDDTPQKVTFKQDNCLYITVQIYPTWFAIAPPVAADLVTNTVTLGHGTDFNVNDQRVGCPHEKYQGPEVPNPWNLLAFHRPGHDTPGGTPNHKTGNPLLDNRLHPNTEDFTPLFPKNPQPDKKSEADTPSTVASGDGTETGITEEFGTANLGAELSLNTGASGENTGATANTPTIQPFDIANTPTIQPFDTANTPASQPFDTAYVDTSLLGNTNTPQDFTVGSTFPNINLGFGAKTRRSARDFRLRA